MIITYPTPFGGTQSITVKIKPDFSPVTTPALSWFPLANGDWAATDRGVQVDQYDADIRLYGKETPINDFIAFIEACRTTSTTPNALTLSNFNAQEKIFGCDVNYSGTIKATAFMERRVQNTWKGFGVPLRLKAITPTFVAGGAFPILRAVTVGYDGDADYTINKIESYNRTFSYQEHSVDSGSFSSEYMLNEPDMISLRRFVANNRAAKFPTPVILGVVKPFGRRAVPPYVRLKDFEDLGLLGGFRCVLPMWGVKFTLVEAF